MSLFDFGKTKKEDQKKTAPETPPVSVFKTGKMGGLAAGILLRPAITEKALTLESSNRYVFEVTAPASKTEIRKAVETAFKVNVLKVNVINNKRREKFSKGKWGYQPGSRKAIIKIAPGQKIDAVPK